MSGTWPLVAVALVAAAIGGGCGGDDDDGSSDQASLQRAAKRLEIYLKANTKDVSGSQAERGKVVSSVVPQDGKLKVWTSLNQGVATDADPARELCRRVRASGVPEAKGALIADAGDVVIVRC